MRKLVGTALRRGRWRRAERLTLHVSPLSGSFSPRRSPDGTARPAGRATWSCVLGNSKPDPSAAQTCLDVLARAVPAVGRSDRSRRRFPPGTPRATWPSSLL